MARGCIQTLNYYNYNTLFLVRLDEVVTVSQGCTLKGGVDVGGWRAGAVRHQPPGRHPSGALVPVTAVTFEAPRVGTPGRLVTPHTLQLQTDRLMRTLLMPWLLYPGNLPRKDAPTLLHSSHREEL